MKLKTNIAKTVEEVAVMARYDAEVKKILSDLQILAWILKYTVKEFKEYDIPDIMICLEDVPEVAVHPVHPEAVPLESYTKPVESIATEDAELGAQRVTYDIRFKVRIPEQGIVGMIINVEAQNEFFENYDLVTRGVFYCARMLSTQVRNEESAEEYNHLQKVYSIWICMQAPLNSEYTITGYHMQREDIHGHMGSTANHRYDLMELVMVCLGRPEDAVQGNKLHQLLTTVLSEKLTPQEKQKIMKEDYNIVTTIELEGGMAKMCNLSEYIWEKAVTEGMEQGIQKGIQKGMQKGAMDKQLENIQAIMLNLNLSAEKAMDALNVVPEERMQYMKQLGIDIE